MITKPKIIVAVILLALSGFFVWFVSAEHAERRRMIAERITMRYGVILVGIDSGYTPPDFTTTIGSEIAARLGMRPAFITAPQGTIFVGLETLQFDIAISSAEITPELRASYNFSKPYMAFPPYSAGTEPGLLSIGFKKGNNRLTEAVNRVLDDMFNDGTMLRLSMDFFGMDIVTQARQAW